MAVMIVARTLSRKTRITRTAKPRPRRPSTRRSSIDCSMNGALVEEGDELDVVAHRLLDAGEGLLDPVRASTVLPSRGLHDLEDMSESSPLVREIDEAGASTSSTSATSLTGTGPSEPPTTSSLIWSTDVRRLPTSTGADSLHRIRAGRVRRGRRSPGADKLGERVDTHTLILEVVFADRDIHLQRPVAGDGGAATPSMSLSSGIATSSRSRCSWLTSSGQLTESMTIGKSASPPE